MNKVDSAAHLDGLQTAEELCLRLFFGGNCGFSFSTSGLSLWGATGCGPSRLYYLDVLLSPDEDIPHLGDVILHQIFVEGVVDLQPIDKGDNGYILIAVVYQGHLALKVINVALQTPPSFHLDRGEVVVVPLDFL